MKYPIAKVSFYILLAATLTSCAGSGTLQKKNVHIYNQDYDRMTKVVKQAIRSGSRTINLTNEVEKDSLMHLQFGQSTYIGAQQVQEAKGEAIIKKMEKNKTSVKIIDPEYSAMIPNRKKIKYNRVITNRIDRILDK